MTCHCPDSFKHVQYIYSYKHVTTKMVLILFLNWVILQILFYLLQINQKLLYLKTTLKYLSLFSFCICYSLYSGKKINQNVYCTIFKFHVIKKCYTLVQLTKKFDA